METMAHRNRSECHPGPPLVQRSSLGWTEGAYLGAEIPPDIDFISHDRSVTFRMGRLKNRFFWAMTNLFFITLIFLCKADGVFNVLFTVLVRCLKSCSSKALAHLWSMGSKPQCFMVSSAPF